MTSLNLEGWKSRLYRKTKSQGTVESEIKGYFEFRAFLKERQKVEAESEFEDLLTSLKSEKANIYGLLDDFAGWLDAKGLMPNTVQLRIASVISFLRYHDIEVSREKLKNRVVIPKAHQIADQPVTREQLRILVGAATARIRALILVLVSSGMRITECASIRVRDLDFESAKPALLIRLRAETTKSDIAREVFASDEATEAVKSLIVAKRPDDLVFFNWSKIESAHHANILRRQYTELLRKIGLTERVEQHRYYALHFHVFRKFFFSEMVGALGETPTQALIGHGAYLQTYYRKPLSERAAEYRAQMSKLYVIRRPETASNEAAIAALRILYPDVPMDELLTRVEKVHSVKWQVLSPEELGKALREEIDKMRTPKALPETSTTYETTSVDNENVAEAERLLAEGWEIVGNMNSHTLFRRRK